MARPDPTPDDVKRAKAWMRAELKTNGEWIEREQESEARNVGKMREAARSALFRLRRRYGDLKALQRIVDAYGRLPEPVPLMKCPCGGTEEPGTGECGTCGFDFIDGRPD